jgi:CRP-like cAMP-binding protein
MAPPPLAARLRRCRFFRELSDATAVRLGATTTAVRLGAGARLWSAGEPARAFAVIERGLVLISVPRLDGDEAILGLFGPHECVGLAAALDEEAVFPASATVLTPSLEALMVPAAATREAAACDPSCATAMRQALLEHTRALRAKIEILSAGKVPSRLASLLLHLAERFGDHEDGGATFIPIVLSRPTLAQLVSARPETVIRTLTRWRKEGTVQADDEGFVVRAPRRLAEIAAGH